MQLTVTNISTSPVPISDLYTTIAVGSSVTTSRSAAQISSMKSLQIAVQGGLVTVTAAPEAWETASGLATAPGSISAGDAAAVAATDPAAATFEIRKSFAAGGGGSADDVIIYALNTLPSKVRILDAYALVSTAISASTLQVRSAAAGAGTLAASMAGTPTGRNPMTLPTASVVLTPGSGVGLFIRRSDSGIAGEVVLTCRNET